MTLAEARILRLAVGTGLCLLFSELTALPLSFAAPALVTVLLGLPLPRLPLKKAVALVLALMLAVYGGMLLLPAVLFYPVVGLLLLALAFYWTFYYTARGGSPLIGTLATMGIAIATAVGTVNLDLLLVISSNILAAALIAIVFVWVAHLLVPDSKAQAEQGPIPVPPEAPQPDLVRARRSALRSTLIVFPVAVWFLASPASLANLPVMIKVAAMGQQARDGGTNAAAKSLLASTLIGGGAAVIGWGVLKINPSLVLFASLVALAGLFMGRRIFAGAGLAADAATWSYGYLTMIVILAPAVADSAMGTAAGAGFVSRLLMFVFATIYAVAAVYITHSLSPWRGQDKAAPASRAGVEQV
jgi:hypothetical protein